MQQQRQNLPAVDAGSRQHSERVAAHLRDCIRVAGGHLSFAQFMHEALYAPGLGYYVAGASKLGAQGDFVTAPEISSLFGKILARQCAPLLRAHADATLFELGAGSGRLAADLLSGCEALAALPARYLILEVSPELAERQRRLLAAELPHLLPRVEWVDRMPRNAAQVIVANEVLDALPVERFVKRKGRTLQMSVCTEGDGFRWCETPPPERLGAAVLEIEAALGTALPDGYCSEVSLGVDAWIAELAASLAEGAIYLFDYGVSRREYYAADRGEGWLRCHFRQHAHSDPLLLPGIQDLSSWVDFTAVAEAADRHGLDVLGYTSQAHFLLHGGLEEEMAGFSELPTEAQMKLSAQLKLLTLPGEMGEHFKCMGLGRGRSVPADALRAVDRTATL